MRIVMNDLPEGPQLLEAEPGLEKSRDLSPTAYSPQPSIHPITCNTDFLLHTRLSWALSTEPYNSPERPAPFLSLQSRKLELRKGEPLAQCHTGGQPGICTRPHLPLAAPRATVSSVLQSIWWQNAANDCYILFIVWTRSTETSRERGCVLWMQISASKEKVHNVIWRNMSLFPLMFIFCCWVICFINCKFSLANTC